MGRSVPGSGFNVQANKVAPGLWLVFGRPECAFQMTLQMVSTRRKQVNIMEQEGNWGTVQCNSTMVSDAKDPKSIS